MYAVYQIYPYVRWSLLIAVLFMLVGCGLENRNLEGGSANASFCVGEGLTAFQSTVYNFSTTNCAACHGDGGVQPPRFAVSSVSTACNATLSTVNFEDSALSTLVNKSRDGHCGTLQCQTDGSQLTSAINAWLDQAGVVTP